MVVVLGTFKNVPIDGFERSPFLPQRPQTASALLAGRRYIGISEKSGIVTTASGGERVKRITVEWNSHTASSSPRALDIYGKRTG